MEESSPKRCEKNSRPLTTNYPPLRVQQQCIACTASGNLYLTALAAD